MSGGTTTWAAFVAVAPGGERLLADELAELLPDQPAPTERIGGLELRIDREALWTLAWRSRLAESLRVRIGGFAARDFATLEKASAKLPWAAYFRRGFAPLVKASCHKSRLIHSDAVAERVARAAARVLAKPQPTPPAPPAPRDPGDADVFVRLYNDKVQVNVNASGALLHRRGWGERVSQAPLRETLAALCLRAAGVDVAATPLWDPFCGGGTIPIEAAAAALGRPAAAGRDFAFEHWPSHPAEAYATWLRSLERGAAVPETPLAYGSDLDAPLMNAARANAAEARVAPAVRFLAGDFAAVAEHVPAGTAVVTNVPWGARVGGDPRPLYGRFGALLRARKDLDPVFVLSAHRDFAAATGLRWDPVLAIDHGGRGAELLRLRR